MRYFFVFFAALTVWGTQYEQEVNAHINFQKEGTEQAPQPRDSLKNPFTDKINSSFTGKIIYNENCATCHGIKGLGNGQASIDLSPKPDTLTSVEINELSDGDLFLGIGNGAHGAMIPWKFVLSEDQRWHLVDYIRELWNTQYKGGKQ